MKYLGVKIDEHLTWKPHIDGISTKRSKGNAMLSKIRDFVDQKALKAIYYTIFESNLYYYSLVWTQNFNSTKRLFILQKNVLRLALRCFSEEEKHILTLSLRILISLNFMIRLHLKTPFLYINALNIYFPNHLITGLDFSQIFIPTTQGDQIWVVLMYVLTELNYMEEILFVLVQFSLGIIFKIFIEIIYFIS